MAGGTVLPVSRGGEGELPPCTKSNLVYENICLGCNPGATSKGELQEIRTDTPTTYIGESSRSIYERSKEHWEGARKNCDKNHMVKHQSLEHGGSTDLKFHMKVRGFFKTALARQVAEAVLIRRRGEREQSSTHVGSSPDVIYLGSKWGIWSHRKVGM